jgi:hypothetical protein
MTAKVYMVGKDPDHLLLVEGTYVVNGAWNLRRKKDGSLGLPGRDSTPVEYVMDAPCGGNYNAVLNRAIRLMKKGEHIRQDEQYLTCPEDCCKLYEDYMEKRKIPYRRTKIGYGFILSRKYRPHAWKLGA